MKVNKLKVIVIYVMAVVVCALVAPVLFTKGMMLDEAYSVYLAKSSVVELVKETAMDVHPPLYYLILKASAVITGYSMIGFKITSVIPTALNLIWLGATVVRKRWGCRVALPYILWFGLSYSTFVFSTQIRMYSWGCFFVTATGLFLFKYYEENKTKDYIVAILFSLAAMYTHYYAVMAVFVAWVILLGYTLIKKRSNLKRIISAGIVIFIGYLPWLGIVFRQSSKVADHYWIQSFRWQDCILSPIELMKCDEPDIAYILFMLSAVFIIIAIITKNKAAICSISVFIGTVVLCGILSVLVAPIWQSRYLYNAWGVFCLAIALVIGEKKNRLSLLPQGLTVAFLMLTGVCSIQSFWFSDLNVNTSNELVAYLDQNIKEGDCVIVDDPAEHRVLYEYYIPQSDIVMSEELGNMNGNVDIKATMEQYQQHNVWFVIDYVLEQMGKEEFEQYLDANGYRLEHKGQYTIQYKILDIYLIEEIADER